MADDSLSAIQAEARRLMTITGPVSDSFDDGACDVVQRLAALPDVGVRSTWTTVDIVDQFERHVRRPELDADARWMPIATSTPVTVSTETMLARARIMETFERTPHPGLDEPDPKETP